GALREGGHLRTPPTPSPRRPAATCSGRGPRRAAHPLGQAGFPRPSGQRGGPPLKDRGDCRRGFVCLLLAALFLPLGALASTEDRLRRAKDFFEYGEYERARE